MGKRKTSVSPPPSTFRIVERRGVWRVTLDGAFYGDFRAKDHAEEAAQDAARAIRANGRAVQVMAPLGFDDSALTRLRGKWGLK